MNDTIAVPRHLLSLTLTWASAAAEDRRNDEDLSLIQEKLAEVRKVMDETPIAEALIVLPAVHICTKCGTKVVLASDGIFWTDIRGGNACDVGVHDADPHVAIEEPSTVCPHCQERNTIYVVDISERWNEAEPLFEHSKLVALRVHEADSTHETDHYLCSACNKPVIVPDDVQDIWP